MLRSIPTKRIGALRDIELYRAILGLAPPAPASRPRRDAELCEHIARVWRENREVYGARKIWKQLQREGHAVGA